MSPGLQQCRTVALPDHPTSPVEAATCRSGSRALSFAREKLMKNCTPATGWEVHNEQLVT